MDALVFTLIWVFGWVLLLILIWHLKGRRRHQRMELIHKERMMAMEKGIPLPELPDLAEPPARRPSLAEAVASIRINPRWPLGLGAVFVMGGAGASLALWLTPPEPQKAWPLGLVGVFFGVGLFFHYFLTRPASR